MSLLYMDLDPIDAIIQKLNDEFWKLAANERRANITRTRLRCWMTWLRATSIFSSFGWI